MATELSAFDMPLCQMSSPTEKQDDVTASDINFTWLDEHCPSQRYQVVGHRSHCILTDISNECLLVQKVFCFFFPFQPCVKKKKRANIVLEYDFKWSSKNRPTARGVSALCDIIGKRDFQNCAF